MSKRASASKNKTRPKHPPERAPKAAASANSISHVTHGLGLGIVAALLLGVFGLQAILSMRNESPTWDETAHLPAGYSYLAAGDYRMNAEHPPLAKMLAAVPLLFLRLDPAFDTVGWSSGDEWRYGWEFLYRKGNDAARIFFWGRLPMVCLTLTLGLVAFLWARRTYGNAAALCTLFLFAFCPNFLAHGVLVNTDVAVSLFFVLSIYCFERALDSRKLFHFVLAGFTVGLALLTKFSALLLLPILAAMALIRLLLRSSEPSFPTWIRTRTTGWRLVATGVLFVVTLVTAYGTLWAGYRFRFSAVPGQDSAALRFPQAIEKSGHSVYRFLELHRLLPQAYLEGLEYVRSTFERECFLDGQNNPGWAEGIHIVRRWPHYFLMTMLYKTPLPLLIILAVVTASAILTRAENRKGEIALALAALSYFSAAVVSNMNIGHRLILPVIAILLIVAGKAVNLLRRPPLARSAFARIVLVALLVWQAAGTLGVYPHHLAYFNEIAGGPANGPQHLTDSNIDWGQDLIALKRYMDTAAIPEIHLYYFGSADPRYYGIRCKFLGGDLPYEVQEAELSTGIARDDYIAISVTHLKETYAPLPGFLSPLKQWQPAARIGYSIYLYRSPMRLHP
jgi:hypothetical protein